MRSPPFFCSAGRGVDLASVSLFMADITEGEAEAPAALRTQRLYQALLENSCDNIALLTADGRTVYQSPALRRQLGYSPDERIGRHNFDLVHPDDLPRAEQRMREVVAGAVTFVPLRLRFRHRDGSWRVLDIVTSRFVDDASGEAFVVTNSRDVTDVVTAAEALQENERRLALAFEAAAMGVTEFDYATRRITYSGNFVRLLGYDPGTVPHSFEWFLAHVHPEDRAAVQSAFEAVTGGEASGEFQYRVVRRDGVMRWWNARARIVADAAGEPVRAIGFVADVTERRHLEDQMRHALKLEAIGRLAGGVAHDFNNLLTVITGYAETLVAAFEPGDPKLGDVIEIRRAAERAAHLTQQLLAFSRKQVLRPELVDANEIVRDVSGMVGRLLGDRIHLRVELGNTPKTVVADRGQIEQVLLNLAVNARDAMPQGGVLTLQTRIVDVTSRDAERLYPIRPARYVLLAVSDTGIGMTPDVQARVFEPFFTTKGPGEGTGIGLATVYGIVKQSGGFIFVESAVGTGTTFDVYLPYTEATVGDDLVKTGDRSPREACTVLLVEDYRPVRDLARKVLTRQGYRVLTASSGDEAVTLAQGFDGTIDVLVSDIVMPGVAGPELARQLQELRPGLSTVFMSGYTGDTLQALGLEGDGAVFLQKPFTPAALAQKVRDVLSRGASRPRARTRQ
jgi:two-component system cell cycle sensor histidine kinase/response regulator CckA